MTGYSVQAFGKMLADEVRMSAYCKALEQVVTPNSTVLDIGCGTGVMALYAAKLGARKVYGIEPSAVIEIGRNAARANGLADKVEFLQGLSDQLELPEPVDIVVSDLRDLLPLNGRHIPSIVDARSRLMKPSGVLIPQSDRIWITVIEAADAYPSLTDPWIDRRFGVDLSNALPFVVNRPAKLLFGPEQQLASPLVWQTVDYRTATETNYSDAHRVTAQRSGTIHAIGAWFDTTLVDGIGFSNAPTEPAAIYGRTAFPLMEPVSVDEGEEIEVKLRADLVNDDYVWIWQVNRVAGDGSVTSGSRQSTFFSQLSGRQDLAKLETGHRPKINPEAQVLRELLQKMDGHQSISEIVAHMANSHPERFSTEHEAWMFVRDTVKRFGE